GHLLEELPRVGRKALNVAPLALGVERVEDERALAASGKPGDHGELFRRELDADVLEVVLADAVQPDRPLRAARKGRGRGGSVGFVHDASKDGCGLVSCPAGRQPSVTSNTV